MKLNKLNLSSFFLIQILFLVFANTSNAQSSTSNIEELIENILEANESEEYDFDTYFEVFTHYAEHPINLNKTSYEELSELHILSEQQINSFFHYLDTERKLINIYELQAVPNIDLNTIYNLLPFVKVSGTIEDFHVPISKLVIKGKHQIFMRYTPSFTPVKNVLGDPSKLYFRYKYNYGNKLSYGITAEKDAYEEFFKGSNKQGFDFYSAHIFFKTNTIFKKIALGDYHLKLGQGLLVWTGFGTGKSSFTMQVKKTGDPLKAYTSVDEYRFFRGIATTIKAGKFSATPFFSLKQVDANISYTDSLETEIESTSLQTFGMHRTQSEIDHKNQLLEMKVGASLQYGKNDNHIGVNFIHTEFDKKLVPKKKAYSQFKTSEKFYTNASLDYSYLLGTFHLFGENALSYSQKEANNLGYAFLNGVLFSADKKVDFSLVHRYYDKQFVTSITSGAFAESTTPNNEHGLYIGTEIRPIKKIKINAYVDIYQFPWLKFQTKTPSFGKDFFAQIAFKPNRVFEMYFRYKNETKQANTRIDLENDYAIVDDNNKHFFIDRFEGIEFEENDLGQQIIKTNKSLTKDKLEKTVFITENNIQKFRFNVKYTIDKTWSFQTRANVSIFDDEINGIKYGFLAFQDIKFKALSFPVSFNLRLAYFDIKDWGAKIYAYENDVLYQFTVSAFNNRGMKTYLNVRYTVIKGIDLWFKISNTYYTGIYSKTSAQNDLKGKNIIGFKTQLRFKF